MTPRPKRFQSTRSQWLVGTGVISLLMYVGLAWLSRRFDYGTPGPERPILTALLLLAALFGLYLFQVALVFRRSEREDEPDDGLPSATGIVVGFAILFRAVLLLSEPIQEVDAYRYVWDGKVIAAGVSPFRYSPDEVMAADAAHPDDELAALARVRDRSHANRRILSRVHFGELTTVYPPVSQTVFAVAALVTPDRTSVQNQLRIMKCFIVAFDLGTLWLLMRLLMRVGRPAEWSIVYGWCPLVMKEFANSGHLDSIAVFFTTWSLLCLVNAFDLCPANSDDRRRTRSKSRPPRVWLGTGDVRTGTWYRREDLSDCAAAAGGSGRRGGRLAGWTQSLWQRLL